MNDLQPRFGDLLRGIYASPDNPMRDGIYVETIQRNGRLNPGKHYRLTDGKGSFWLCPAESVVAVDQASGGPLVPKGHFWRGPLDRDHCQNCGRSYFAHTRDENGNWCPEPTR